MMRTGTRKGVIAALILAAGFILVSAVYAHFPGDGFGTCQANNIDLDAVKKFQHETLQLRDELLVKKLELRKEFSKEKPDRDRIAKLKKEIIDIRTKIMKKADETGVPLKNVREVRCGGRQFEGMNEYHNCTIL